MHSGLTSIEPADQPPAAHSIHNNKKENVMRNLKHVIGDLTREVQIVAILAIVVLAACAPQGAQPSPELAAMSERWEEGLNGGDIEMLASMYTADAQLMPPNSQMMQGSDAVRAEFGEMIEDGFTADLESLDAAVSGDLGYRVGTYTIFAPDDSAVDTGKYIELWRKTAAGWQITHDIWNSDLAADAGKTYVNFTHKVKDPDVWLAAWTGPNSRREMFAENGAGEIKVFQAPDDPKRVGLLVEVTDMDAMMAWLNSPEGAAAKAEDGVIDSSLIFMTEVK